VAADGGQPQLLLPNFDQVNSDATWSPDGKRVSFGGATSGGRDSGPNIQIVELATGAGSDVPGSEGYFSPRWSPDGQSIAALSLDSTRLALFRFATGRWEDLARGIVSFPCWSADSRIISYVQSTNNPAVMRVRVADRKVERVIDLKDISLTGFYGHSLALAPDNSPVMTLDGGSMEIFSLDWRTP